MIIKVACAVIVNNNKILAAKRSEIMPHAGFWEFPGGKIEEGENAEDCLCREIAEELHCQVNVVEMLPSFQHEYSCKKIELIPFLCELNNGIPNPAEHEELCWLSKTELLNIKWLPADIPIAQYIVDRNLLG